MISMIVTVDRSWGISKEHKPLISIPDDMKFVRDSTYGKVMLMGRHTFEHFFNGKVLPYRTMVIVSKDPTYKVPGAQIVQSSKDAIDCALSYNTDVFILGGKKLYHDLLPMCDEVHVTAVDYTYMADSWFPNLDKDPEWVLMDLSEEQTHFDVVYYFKHYMRRKNYKV